MGEEPCGGGAIGCRCPEILNIRAEDFCNSFFFTSLHLNLILFLFGAANSSDVLRNISH